MFVKHRDGLAGVLLRQLAQEVGPAADHAALVGEKSPELLGKVFDARLHLVHVDREEYLDQLETRRRSRGLGRGRGGLRRRLRRVSGGLGRHSRNERVFDVVWSKHIWVIVHIRKSWMAKRTQT